MTAGTGILPLPVEALRRAWRVAVIDSGLDPHASIVLQARCWCAADGSVHSQGGPREDATGHGTRVAGVIYSTTYIPDLFVAQVLNERGTATVAAVASAIDWAIGQNVDLIHMSLGLAGDRPDLASAVARAVERGITIVASAPARGARPFPARYPGVIAATGDARCDAGQIAELQAANADFAGCVRLSTDTSAPGRGASIGAAHVTRFIVEHVPPVASLAIVRRTLSESASYRGAERR